MIEPIHCSICRGRKKILGLGSMMKECPSCKGAGWIEIEVKTCCGEPIEETMDIPKVKKKPGRKPKDTVMHV